MPIAQENFSVFEGKMPRSGLTDIFVDIDVKYQQYDHKQRCFGNLMISQLQTSRNTNNAVILKNNCKTCSLYDCGEATHYLKGNDNITSQYK